MADTFTKAERSRIMAAVKARDTTPEMIVRRLDDAFLTRGDFTQAMERVPPTR